MSRHFCFNPLSDTHEKAVEIANNATSNNEKLILYFHGGLSKPEYVTGKLGPLLSETLFAETYLEHANAKVVYILYEAGLFELKTLGNTLNNMRQNPKLDKIIKRVENWLRRREISDEAPAGLTRATLETQQVNAANTILGETGLMDIDDDDEEKITNVLTAYLQETSRQGDGEEVLAAFNVFDDYAEQLSANLISKRFSLTILYRVIKRFWFKSSHGVIATLIEEIANYSIFKDIEIGDFPQGHWQKIYDNAQNLWSTQNRHTNGAGEVFMQTLNDLLADRDDFKIDLISHSAGSIPICYFLKAQSAYDNLTVNKVLPIAPAVRMLDFYKQVVSQQDRFVLFRMYTLDERTEESDNVFVYPRSLLYFVSGCADTPKSNPKVRKRGEQLILGLHRHFQRDRERYCTDDHFDDTSTYGDLEACRDFLHADGRTVMCPNSGSDEPGMVGGGTSHGGTKTPHTSKELSKSLIYMYSEGAVTPDMVEPDTANWAQIAQRYGH